MSNNKKDSLGDRMKGNYENRSKTYLVRRTPVIVRLDGKSFHTFTRGFKRPYDEIFHTAMNNTLKYLCENIQGCKFGYTQSDEITLLLMDDDTLTTGGVEPTNDNKIEMQCDEYDRGYIVGKVHGMLSMLDADNEVKGD